MKPQISKYQITWIELVPKFGIVTKHDRKQFGDPFLYGKDLKHYVHLPNREKAMNWLRTFNKRLDKTYECRLFTDGQFSKSKYVDGQMVVPFTTKQRNEIYYIG